MTKESIPEAEAMLEPHAYKDTPHLHGHRRRGFWGMPAFVLNVIIFVASITIWTGIFVQRHSPAIEQPDSSDLLDARRSNAVQYEMKSYSNVLDYDPATRRAVMSRKGERQFVGPPSEAIDEAWDELLRGTLPFTYHDRLIEICKASC